MLHPELDSPDPEYRIGSYHHTIPLACYPAMWILPSSITLSHYPPVPFYDYPTVPLYNYPAVPLYNYPDILLAAISPPDHTTNPPSHTGTFPLPYSPTPPSPLYCYRKTPLPHYILNKLSNSPTVKLWNNLTTPLSYCHSIALFRYTAIPLSNWILPPPMPLSYYPSVPLSDYPTAPLSD